MAPITYADTHPSQSPTLTGNLEQLVRELEEVLPQVQDWRISYDPQQDFHRLEFTADGHRFLVRHYKVYTICRDGMEDCFAPYPPKNFGFSTQGIWRLFRSGRHLSWEDR